MLRRIFTRRRYTWDVFISYAGEDRDAVAVPIATKLREGGFQVWLDQLELHLGDSLSEQIARGIRKSRFGVIIFSEAYLAKRWTNTEFELLLRVEADGDHTILPILHGLGIEVIEERYPALADRYFGDTRDGIEALADSIVQTVTDPKYSSPSVVAPGLRRRFLTLLERDPSHTEIVQFLKAHREILYRRLGIILPDRRLGPRRGIDLRSEMHWSPAFSVDNEHATFMIQPDLYVGDIMGTSYSVDWKLVFLKTPSYQIFAEGTADSSVHSGTFTPALAAELEQIQAFYTWYFKFGRAETQREDDANGVAAALQEFVLYASSVETFIIAGRRDRLSTEQRRQLRRLNESLQPTSIRTFDWLIESLSLEA